MGTQMTERFSAPGATLVKLFGRPDEESHEFAVRAGRVRDIGVRTAMLQFTFVTALTLVSALALALVYGLGGVLALSRASWLPATSWCWPCCSPGCTRRSRRSPTRAWRS